MCFGNSIQSVDKITIHEVSSILLDFIGDNDVEIYLPDNMFPRYSLPDVEKFLERDGISKLGYEREDHDCDDFARKLFGKFAGLVWTRYHALNWFIDTRNTLMFVEPQNDTVFSSVGEDPKQFRFFLGR